MSVVSLHPSTRSSTTTRLPPDHRRETFWLDAAPFRAHIEHVLAASHLTERELAALTRVPVRLIRRMRQGRNGRPVRRIDPVSARRLIGVTALQACLVRSTQVSSGPARARLLVLRDRGRSDTSIVRLTGLAPGDLDRLVADRLAVVPQLVDLRLAAAVAEIDARPEISGEEVPPESARAA